MLTCAPSRGIAPDAVVTRTMRYPVPVSLLFSSKFMLAPPCKDFLRDSLVFYAKEMKMFILRLFGA
jgi:hypothetical protein